MKRIATQVLAVTLAIILLLTLVPVMALATGETATETVETVWNGGDMAVNVTAGKNGYTHLSVYTPPYHAYEMSNHMVTAGETNSIPQTLVMIDATEDYTWTPDGPYTFAGSNYEVLYCCDAYTGYNDGIYYKRMNLEDSGYYSAEEAAHIRAIITNSYPFISIEQMKQNLAAEGFEGAAELDRAEIIAAVQSAVWYFSNGADYRYKHTFNIQKNTQWGGVMHDYTAEMSAEIQALGKRKFLVDEAVGNRVNGLMDYLKGLDAVYAEKNEIIVSDIEILDAVPVQEKSGVYTVVLRLVLNNSGTSSQDNITANIYVGDELVVTEAVKLGTNEYQACVEAYAGDVIKAVISGTQIMPKGVYFYEPEGGRDVSQCLVGVAMGQTDVYAEASVSLDFPTMLLSTGDIALKKVDENGNALTGAKFELYCRKDGFDYFINTYDVDSNGELIITDLLPGQYVLKEAAAPATYNKLTEEIVLTITDDGATESDALPEGVTFNKSRGTVEITVVNTKISTKVTLQGTKFLNGEKAEGFRFALKQDGNVLQTVTSDKEGIFTFEDLVYTEEGVYTYQVVEVADEAMDVTYDETVFTVTVTVVRDGEQLIATTEGAEAIHFHNETLPKTGDPITIAIAVALASLMGMCILPKHRS